MAIGLDVVLKHLADEQAEENQPRSLTVLEPEERPAPNAELPLFRRLSDRDCLEFAAELAADMETGLYTPEGETKPWKEGTRFNIAEIMKRMGYSRATAYGHRPRWWPEGGTTAFKGYVEWKVQERRMLGRVSYDRLVPYIEALTFKGFAEMARRIMLDPRSVKFRDLAQFTMRGAEIIKGQANPLGGPLSASGADAYENIHKAIAGVGDETAQKAIAALFDATLAEAHRRARASSVSVVEIPAKTA